MDDTGDADTDADADTDTDADADTDADTVPVPLGEPEPCYLIEVSGPKHLEESIYYGSGDNSECRCDVRLAVNEDTVPTVLNVHLEGSKEEQNSWDLVPADSAVQFGTQIFHDEGIPDTSQWDWIWWDDHRWSTGGDDPSGSWAVYLSRRPQGDDAVPLECEDYLDVEVTFSSGSSARLFPPKRMISPLGPETDRDCVPGETHTTRFQLVGLPELHHLSPLATGGYGRYAGAKVRSVTVTGWNNTEELRMWHGGSEVLLTPTQPSALIAAPNWWYGSNRWQAWRSEDQPLEYPEIELLLEGPASPVGETLATDQGYALSIQALNAAVAEATGGLGFGDLVTGAQSPTLPVFAVRVRPIPHPQPGGPTHALRLEQRGTWAGFGLALYETGQDSWTLDTNGPSVDLEGTVTRSGTTLTIAISRGTVTDEAGSAPLQATTLVLNALGAD